MIASSTRNSVAKQSPDSRLFEFRDEDGVLRMVSIIDRRSRRWTLFGLHLFTIPMLQAALWHLQRAVATDASGRAQYALSLSRLLDTGKPQDVL